MFLCLLDMKDVESRFVLSFASSPDEFENRKDLKAGNNKAMISDHINCKISCHSFVD